MSFIIHFEDGSSGYLSHHGTKGMKWGKWNEETRARYTKAGKTSRMQGAGGYSDNKDKHVWQSTSVGDPFPMSGYNWDTEDWEIGYGYETLPFGYGSNNDPEYKKREEHYMKVTEQIIHNLPNTMSGSEKRKRANEIYNTLFRKEQNDLKKSENTKPRPHKRGRSNNDGIVSQLTDAYKHSK